MKYNSFIIFFTIAGLIFFIAFKIPGYTEIKSRILENGTVEYYSGDACEEEKPFRKQTFKSPYIPLIERISEENDIDPYLVKCVIKAESDFNPDAVSVAGAMGLMQIMQEIAEYYCVKDPFDPEENLSAGIRHLKFLLDYFKNDIELSIAAYHAGIGRVKKNMKVPPIRSTIDYVDSIMRLYNGTRLKDEEKIKRLFKRVNEDGVIEIYDGY